MSTIDDIRNKLDIVELISSSGVNLRKTGRSFVGFCPFHPNTRTPAFTVYPDTQSFYCFGCQAAGDIFGYTMRKQGLDFRQALEYLAARAGVRLEPKGDQERQEDARRTRLLEINKAAALYFSYILREMKRGEPARAYVEKRQINTAMIEAFQLGYSLEEWGHLFAYLTERKGFTPDDVVAAGLAIHHETRGYYDRFRGRLIFPIRNAKGEIVGFGGRALGDGQPKYLNTPETPLFKKGELLYGLDLAREAIRTADRTVVVEGYVDVITAHQHGFANVVAPLGTALTKSHIALLKRLSHNVYMALDADAAGQRATLKGLNSLRESVGEDGDGHLVATAQGAVRLESDVTLRIIRMPEGRDPDDVIRADAEQWRTLVDAAVPVMEFYLGAYTAGLDLTNPLHQREALDKLLPLIAELDGVNQRVYIARVEQVIGIRAELILDLLKGQSGGWRPSIGGRRQGAGGREQAAGSRRQGAGGREQTAGGRRKEDKGKRSSDEGPSVGLLVGPQRAAATPTDAPHPADADDAPHPADAGDAPHPADEFMAAPNAPTEEPAPRRAPMRAPVNADERYLLLLALHYPTVDAAVEALLEQSLAAYAALRRIFGAGLASLLSDPVHQEIWRQYSSAPLEQRPTSVEGLTAWAQLLPEHARGVALEIIEQIARRPHNFRHRSEAEDCALKLRIAQVKHAQARISERARHAEADEIDQLAQQLSQLVQYLGSLQKPRRSTTFPDLRDTLGQ
jgi:DNA primase